MKKRTYITVELKCYETDDFTTDSASEGARSVLSYSIYNHAASCTAGKSKLCFTPQYRKEFIFEWK